MVNRLMIAAATAALMLSGAGMAQAKDAWTARTGKGALNHAPNHAFNGRSAYRHRGGPGYNRSGYRARAQYGYSGRTYGNRGRYGSNRRYRHRTRYGHGIRAGLAGFGLGLSVGSAYAYGPGAYDYGPGAYAFSPGGYSAVGVGPSYGYDYGPGAYASYDYGPGAYATVYGSPGGPARTFQSQRYNLFRSYNCTINDGPGHGIRPCSN